jgi:glyoxylase-like metal-dependent hydrolase (beta-lactamase superfamily II)
MNIDSIVVGPLGVNCYIVSDGGEAVIVDPGGHAGHIAGLLDKNKLKPVAIVNTHGHFDHIGAVSELIDKYSIPFKLHRDDEFLVGHGSQTGTMFGFPPTVNPDVSEYIKEGDVIKLNGLTIRVIHTPGHTPGGVSLYVPELKSVITGDTLFLESIGRSDFPYADHSQLLAGIRNGLWTLPDDVRVLPGHGPASSIGHEKKYNPFM